MGHELLWENNLKDDSRKTNLSISSRSVKKVTEDKPLRGPNNFEGGDFEYFNKSEGTLEDFEGEEKIFYKKQLVYQLNYNRGLIAEK